MPGKLSIAIFKQANHLYKHSFPIYYPLYRVYKSVAERELISAIRNIVRPGMNVLDVGANVGFYTILLSKLVGPTGSVYSFEPAPENFKRLQQNTAPFKNVFIFQKAAGNQNGSIRLYLSDQLNVDHRSFPTDGEVRQFVEADVVRLEDFLPPDRTFQFVKMDVQGFEHQVLLGLEKVLNASNHFKMVLELWPCGMKMAGSSAEQFIEWLRSKGFSVKPVIGQTIQTSELDADFYMDLIAQKTGA